MVMKCNKNPIYLKHFKLIELNTILQFLYANSIKNVTQKYMNNLSGFEDSLHGAQTNADIFGLNMLSTANLVKCIDGKRRRENQN